MRLKIRDSESTFLYIDVSEDGDIWLTVNDPFSASARFCGFGGDGAYAPKTKQALRGLIAAVLADNADGRIAVAVTP